MVKKSKSKENSNDILNLANFVLFNTMLLHENFYHNYNGYITKSLAEISNFRRDLINEWERIYKFEDIGMLFLPGLQILSVYPESKIINEMLFKLKELVFNFLGYEFKIENNILGKTYNELLLKVTSGLYACYFTQYPAAILLANLIINKANSKWDFKKIDFYNDFKIVDPACGSGILLTAIYKSIKNIYKKFIENADELLIHKLLIEKILWGYDVIYYNIGLTLIMLSNLCSQVKLNNFNISLLLNGIDANGKLHLGSLSLLENVENFEKFDVIIMNPPFSRSAKPNVKFGYENREIKRLMEKKLIMIGNRFGFKGVGRAGLAAYFIILADKLLKKGGRLGCVLPRAVLSGVSWEKIREMIWNNYEIEYIISNYDPGNKLEGIEGWNWSEDTDLGEILLIARKSDNPIADKETVYVNFLEKPKNEVESTIISEQILNLNKNKEGLLLNSKWNYITYNNALKSIVYKVPQSIIRNNWHIPCVFSHPKLNKFIIDIMNQIPSISLGSLLKNSGRDIKQVKTHFKRSDFQTEFPIIYGLQSTMNKIYLDRSFIKYGFPRFSNSSKFHSDNKSNILLATRPHLTNDCIIAAESEEKVLATAFWELKLMNNKFMPFLLLWLNSTFGFLLVIAHSTNSKAQTFRLKKGQLINIPIPKEIFTLNVEKFYKTVRNEKFEKFLIEFQNAYINNSGLRKKVDDYLIRKLNLEYDLKPIYKLLIGEPCLTRTRRKFDYY
ncbi:MAG: Eco57I restriction-modification methylase domain-containing protein [Candidatus Helarchaeota archaeon]